MDDSMQNLAAPSPGFAADEAAYRQVGRLIKYVFASLLRRIDQRMQPLGLTAMQWEPVLLLSMQRADTVAALARESGVDCGAMTRMLDRLESKELLRRQRSSSDRRVVHLELTEEGHAVSREIAPIVFEEVRQHLSDFSATEVATLTDLLGRMLTNGSRVAATAE